MIFRQKYNDTTAVPTRFLTFFCGQSPALAGPQNGSLTFHRSTIQSYIFQNVSDQWHSFPFDPCQDAFKWWNAVLDGVNDKTALTILTYDAIPQLALTDFWDWSQRNAVWFWHSPLSGNGAGKSKWKGSLVLADPPVYVTARFGKKTLKIVDLRNYLDLGIVELLQTAGYRTHHYSAGPQPGFCSDVAALEIAHALGTVYSKWLTRWKEQDCGVWQPTAARLAMNSYRHLLGKHNTRIERDNLRKPISEWEERPIPRVVMDDDLDRKRRERTAYFCGRAEAFYVGTYTGKCYYVDVRSMYPYLAANVQLPYSFNRELEKRTPDNLVSWYPAMQCIAEVTVQTNEPRYPVRVWKDALAKTGTVMTEAELPARVDSTMVLFPTGRFRTVLCGEELYHAVSRNEVRQVHWALQYRCAFLFTEFMEYWYGERQIAESHGDRTYALLCKMMMNSLIGKYGQRSAPWLDRPDVKALYQWGTAVVLRDGEKKAIHQRFIAGHVQELQEAEEVTQSFPALSAFVCSAGRVMLWDLLNWAGLENVLFCHTDGFAVTEKGLSNLNLANLLSGEGWGTLRITDTADSATIKDMSHYWWGSDRVESGFPLDRQMNYNGCVFGWTKNHAPSDPALSVPGTFKVKLLAWGQKTKYIGRVVGDNGCTTAWSAADGIRSL